MTSLCLPRWPSTVCQRLRAPACRRELSPCLKARALQFVEGFLQAAVQSLRWSSLPVRAAGAPCPIQGFVVHPALWQTLILRLHEAVNVAFLKSC